MFVQMPVLKVIANQYKVAIVIVNLPDEDLRISSCEETGHDSQDSHNIPSCVGVGAQTHKDWKHVEGLKPQLKAGLKTSFNYYGDIDNLGVLFNLLLKVFMLFVIVKFIFFHMQIMEIT